MKFHNPINLFNPASQQLMASLQKLRRVPNRLEALRWEDLLNFMQEEPIKFLKQAAALVTSRALAMDQALNWQNDDDDHHDDSGDDGRF